MNLRRTRLIYQIVFLGLFVFLIAVTAETLMERYPINLFLNMSVLNGLTTILSQQHLAAGMFLGVAIAAATLFVGRFFCGWICPMGSCQHFGSSVFKSTDRKTRYQRNTFHPYYKTKYLVLTVVLFSAVFGLVLAGWFDPIALITRFSITVVWPLINLFSNRGVSQTVAFNVTLLTGAIFIGAFLLNAVRPRFWCRFICPLGAILSIFSLKPVFRMVRNKETCIDCGRCRETCQGGCDIDKDMVVSECLMCMNCIDICPVGAICYKATPKTSDAAVKPLFSQSSVQLTRRDFVISSFVALGSLGVLRNFKNIVGRGYEKRIRPPGALAEADFLARCIRCGQCMKACPTNVLQPAKTQTDIEGLWTPVLVMDKGWCDYDCTLCSQVCPTGALTPLTLEQKHQEGYGRIGTAYVDRNRCLPWAYGKTCLVCQEVCPVSPKAILHQKQTFIDGDGQTVELDAPYIDADRCIGCGACEFNCPLEDQAGIRITSIGEHRSPDRKLSL